MRANVNIGVVDILFSAAKIVNYSLNAVQRASFNGVNLMVLKHPRHYGPYEWSGVVRAGAKPWHLAGFLNP